MAGIVDVDVDAVAVAISRVEGSRSFQNWISIHFVIGRSPSSSMIVDSKNF